MKNIDVPCQSRINEFDPSEVCGEQLRVKAIEYAGVLVMLDVPVKCPGCLTTLDVAGRERMHNWLNEVYDDQEVVV